MRWLKDTQTAATAAAAATSTQNFKESCGIAKNLPETQRALAHQHTVFSH